LLFLVRRSGAFLLSFFLLFVAGLWACFSFDTFLLTDTSLLFPRGECLFLAAVSNHPNSPFDLLPFSRFSPLFFPKCVAPVKRLPVFTSFPPARKADIRPPLYCAPGLRLTSAIRGRGILSPLPLSGLGNLAYARWDPFLLGPSPASCSCFHSLVIVELAHLFGGVPCRSALSAVVSGV